MKHMVNVFKLFIKISAILPYALKDSWTTERQSEADVINYHFTLKMRKQFF